MNNQIIERLIDKYFAGETSLAEEQQLRDYFSGENVHPDLKEYAPLFQYFNAAASKQLSDDFDDKLFEKINALESETSKETAAPKKARVINLTIRRFSRVAAAVVLALAAWWLYPEIPKSAKEQSAEAIDWSKYEVKSAEEAYSLTLNALRKTSTEINSGASKAASQMSKSRIHWKKILNEE